MPFGEAFDRSGVVRRRRHALQPGSRTEIEVAVFPWAMLVGQRFYGEPESEMTALVAAAVSSARRTTKPAASAGGAARASRAPSSSRCANKC